MFDLVINKKVFEFELFDQRKEGCLDIEILRQLGRIMPTTENDYRYYINMHLMKDV